MGNNRTKIRSALIRGTHPYSFRAGEWAEIIGVVMSTPLGLDERLAYKCEYQDGVVDYIPVDDNRHYVVKGKPYA